MNFNVPTEEVRARGGCADLTVRRGGRAHGADFSQSAGRPGLPDCGNLRHRDIACSGLWIIR